MSEIKTKRPFEQRFLDGYDRSQLRREVEKIRPRKKLGGLRKKYAGWALGASLALGGVGVPMKMIQNAQQLGTAAKAVPAPAQPLKPDDAIGSDLKDAAAIAGQVAGTATGAVTAVAQGVEQAAKAPIEGVSSAPRALTAITDAIRQQFFSREVPFGSIIYSAARQNDLPPELVAAVVHTESKFNPNARSQAGAIGLMQLVPRTGRWMGAKDLRNPSDNITAGAKYLKYLSDRFGGDQQKIIAAYNAGEGNVRRFNGIPPFQETRDYVSRVQNFQQDLGDRLAGQAETSEASLQP